MVDTPIAFRLPVVDFSHSQSGQIEDFTRRAAEEFISEEIDVAVGPLFAAMLFRLSHQDHVLLVGIDHFISDAVSLSILTRDILAFYRPGSDSETHRLSPPSVQYPDFAVWQAGTQEAWARRNARYWQSRLATAEKIFVPLDHHRPSSADSECDILHIPLGKAVSAALADIARNNATRLPLIVLSIQLLIMSVWCQKRTLLVEVFSHGRKGSSLLRNMIGFLAYPMYLVVEVVAGETFKDLIRRVTEEFHSAWEHDASRTTGNLVTGEPTELHFNWTETGLKPEGSSLGLAGNLRMQPFPIKMPLSGRFAPLYHPTPSGVVAEIWYGRELFKASTLRWFENGLRSVVRGVADDPAARVRFLQSLCIR